MHSQSHMSCEQLLSGRQVWSSKQAALQAIPRFLSGRAEQAEVCTVWQHPSDRHVIDHAKYLQHESGGLLFGSGKQQVDAAQPLCTHHKQAWEGHCIKADHYLEDRSHKLCMVPVTQRRCTASTRF